MDNKYVGSKNANSILNIGNLNTEFLNLGFNDSNFKITSLTNHIFNKELHLTGD
jgi:hypothetical protein